MSDSCRTQTATPDNISGDCTVAEFAAALQNTKPDKSFGPDSICPGLIIHAGAALKSWLRGFLCSCLPHFRIPKFWKSALVFAIPKPSKPRKDPKSYWSISLFCVPCKIFERLIHVRVKPITDSFSFLNRLDFGVGDQP